MTSSNSWNVGRKLSVHLTRLTDADIVEIRCHVNRDAKKKQKDPKSKSRKKEPSYSQPSEPTASSANCVSNLTDDDVRVLTRLQKRTYTRVKKKSASSSSKRPPKRKYAVNTSAKPSTEVLTAHSSSWNDYQLYSTSEESEMEEVFIPQKIWKKPSARPISPTSSKSTASETVTHETPLELKFPIRKPVVLLRKMGSDTVIKDEICDDTVPTSRLRTRNSSSCSREWPKISQRRSVRVKQTSSRPDYRESESEESADEKFRPFADEFEEKPALINAAAASDSSSHTASIAISEVSANPKITRPSQCDCQLAIVSTKSIAVETNRPQVSTQSTLLTNEPVASTQKTLSSADAAVERNRSDDAICSPVIFDESQATQDVGSQVSSPIIFGSNEGTAAESGDARSDYQFQEATLDRCNFSSSFVLELTADEQSEASSKNADLTSVASQNYNLQLSDSVSHSPPIKGRKSAVPVGISNDAFTQTDLEVQQPSQLSVNYIINSSRLDTIRFEGPVLNHPSMTAIGEKVVGGPIFVPVTHCPRVFSPNRIKSPCECNVRNVFHCSEVTDLPKSDQLDKSSTAEVPACSDSISDSEVAKQSSVDVSRFSAFENVIDSIELTSDDESECSSLGKIRPKTPSELGCTIAFTDDLERLSCYELPKLPCNLEKLEWLKKKNFEIFKVVLAKYIHGKPVNETLEELYRSRSVPCGSNLMRHSLPGRHAPEQMLVRAPTLPTSSSSSFYRNLSGIGIT